MRHHKAADIKRQVRPIGPSPAKPVASLRESSVRRIDSGIARIAHRGDNSPVVCAERKRDWIDSVAERGLECRLGSEYFPPQLGHIKTGPRNVIDRMAADLVPLVLENRQVIDV